MASLPPYADPAERMKSIGSSDVGVILGVSTFMSPVQLYLLKRGEMEPPSETMAMRMGKKLEPVCAEIYTEDTGTQLRRRNITQRLKGYDYITSHVDRMAVGFPKIVEIKCPGVWGNKGFGDVGTDDIPPAYLAQVLWQMGICGVPVADVAVLCGHAFGIYPVEFDADLFADMLEKAHEFWARVVCGNPPEPESEEDCKALWPSAKSSVVVVVGEDCVRAAQQYHDAKKAMAEAKVQVQIAMQEYEVVADDRMNILATYKNQPDTRLDQKAFKEAEPEMFEKYTRTKQIRKLLIKERKDD